MNEVSIKSKIETGLKIQFNTFANLLFEFGSIRRLNKIYNPEIIIGRDSSKIQNLIGRAYRRSRGELDKFVKNLPKHLDPLFLESFTDNGFSNLEVPSAIQKLKSDGVYVVPFLIPDELIQGLQRLINSGVASPKSDIDLPITAGIPNDSAATWWLDQREILANQTVQNILTNKFLVAVAQGYLESQPKLVSCAMWKSFPAARPQKSGAQWFHVDYDRVSFVKAFIYLDDVDLNNGPHVYVRRSHRRKPWMLLSGKRISDLKVSKSFEKNCWTTVIGKSGTLFFADTRGLHKGDGVIEGTRSIFSITYSIDNFGYHAGQKAFKSSITNQNLVQTNKQFPRYLESVLIEDI
jgi:hypothetical protein